jgi:hypothetical protein
MLISAQSVSQVEPQSQYCVRSLLRESVCVYEIGEKNCALESGGKQQHIHHSRVTLYASGKMRAFVYPFRDERHLHASFSAACKFTADSAQC